MVRCVSIDVFIGSFEYRFGCRFEHRFEGYSGVGFEYGLVRRIVTKTERIGLFLSLFKIFSAQGRIRLY